MIKRNMPDGWKPPYPAWSAKAKRDVVILHLGVQSREADFSGFVEPHPISAAHLDEATFKNASGDNSRLTIAYFSNTDELDCYLDSDGFKAWWTDAIQRPHIGVWHEAYVIPPDRFETLYSFATQSQVGILSLAPSTGPIAEHGYDGAMRDRLGIAGNDPLDTDLGSIPGRETDVVRGLVRVAPPANLAVIRSGQDWSQCGEEERECYLTTVAPLLARAMHDLRDRPVETGAISCNLMREHHRSGAPLDRTFGLAQFRSLAELEKWAKSHPKHVAVLQSFFGFLDQFGPESGLRLYHEVFVTPTAAKPFEYVNCRKSTGILSIV